MEISSANAKKTRRQTHATRIHNKLTRTQVGSLKQIQDCIHYSSYLRYQADVNIGKVRETTAKLELAECLHKWHPLNVTDSTTKLGMEELSTSCAFSYTTHTHTRTRAHTHTHTHTHTHLNNTDVWSLLVLSNWDLGNLLNPLLNGISNMWNHCGHPRESTMNIRNNG